MAEKTNSKQEERDEAALADGLLRNVQGLAEEFSELPNLQQALVHGAARSAERESERLRRLHGDDDARVAAAEERVGDMRALHRQVKATLDYGTKAGEIVNARNLFHGYVMGEGGTPAPKHEVRVHLLDDRIEKDLLSGITDGDGYFRIELPCSGERPDEDQQEDPTQEQPRISVAGRPSQALGLKQADVTQSFQAKTRVNLAAEKATPETAAQVEEREDEDQTGSDAGGLQSRVLVLDPDGCVVLRDLDPPLFQPPRSEFRHYLLGGVSAGEEVDPDLGKKQDSTEVQ